MNLPPEPDEPLARRLREANALLDEQPSAKVRTAVLQAAAQRDLDSARGASKHAKPGAALLRWLAWRPPLAAGATALAGVLAITIGMRFQQEQGALDHGLAAPSVAPSAPSGKAAPSPQREGQSAVMPSAPAYTRTPSAAVSGQDRSVRGGTPPQTDAAEQNAVPFPGGTADERASGAAAGQPPTAQSSTQALLRSARPAGGETQGEGPAAQVARPDVQAGEPAGRQARIAPDARMVESPAPGASVAASPQRWLTYIAQLRASHRDAEADQELARFVAAYPDFVVPENVQRR